MDMISKRAEFKQKSQNTINQFETFFDIYDKVYPYLNIEESKKLNIPEKKDWIEKLQQTEFTVAFLGSYSAGKSTIINGILGREVLPEANESTTAFPTIVKKGKQDQAIIYFMTHEERMALWDSYVSEIALKIGESNLKREENELPAKHLNRINDTVKKYEEKYKISIDQKALKKLQIILNNFGKEEYKRNKEIPLTELKNYVEGYAGAIFVDRVEVSLEKLSIEDDIVLVDLPGLGVDNNRHVEFTKDYIKEKAKAFVVCISPFNVLQGQEIDFLSEINKCDPTIIQRAFWVINKWDLPNQTQQKEALNSFDKRIQEYNFLVRHNRRFQISALNYLLLKVKAEGTIDESQKLSSHLDNLVKSNIVDDLKSLNQTQAEALLDNNPNVSSFTNFLDSLFTYLNEEAKDEFLADSKKELHRIIRILDTLLKPLDDQYSQSTDLKTELQSIAINQKFRNFKGELEKHVKRFAQEIRTGDQRHFWQESDTAEILKEIDKRILSIDREELSNNLRKGMDVDFNISRLPDLLDKKINLTLLMRGKLLSVIDNYFIKRLNQLLNDLETINSLYLPEKLREDLVDKLDERDISMRLNGLADALLHAYGKELQRLGLSLEDEEGKTFSERLEKILILYKTSLDELTVSMVKDLNDNIRLSLKNHTEYLEVKLLQLFDRQENSIIAQISRNTHLDNAIADETNKQQLISNSYTQLTALKNEVMSSLMARTDEFPENSSFVIK